VSSARHDPFRILIVDDEPAIRRFASRVLLAQGYDVQEAADGAEALALVREGRCRAHVIVSDVVMPRLSGVELLQALATSHPHVPILLMSGYAAAQLEGMGIAAPCGMLAKPFTAERLLEEVQRCLGDGDPMGIPGPTRASA